MEQQEVKSGLKNWLRFPFHMKYTMSLPVTPDSRVPVIRKWWYQRRCMYNKGLVISGFIAFVLYCILGEIIIARHEEFEETIFEMAFQGGVYLFMMVIANLCYTLGSIADMLFNVKNSSKFRERLFTIGYWFSFSLPILLILSIMVSFLVKGK